MYNEMLADRKNAYDRCGIGLNYTQQAGQLTYLNLDIHSQVAQDVLRRLDKAFQNFFRRVKNGEKPGYPRFQGKSRYDSFTYPQSGFKILDDGKLKLSKIGTIRMFVHREIVGKIKTCTILRDGDQWYACFSVELPNVEKVEPKTAIGVDLGINTLATLSDGTVIENPKTLDKYDSKLRKAQKDLSRKKKGSNNRNKQKTVLKGAYRKVRNARKDYMHKASRILADTYDMIVFEDLQIKNDFFTKNRVKTALRVGLAIYFFVNENHHLARSIHDASWNMLINFTTYKAEEAGGSVELVNPRNTSKLCSVCGCIQAMPLSQRTYRCPDCGSVMDRDHNAAINILNRHVPADCGELTPVEMVA
jgi:putative transposase